MIRSSAIVLALIALFGFAACGDDESTSSTRPAEVAGAEDVDRYCALTRRLDAEGEQFFAGLDEDSSPAEYEAAERRSVEHFADEFAELQRVAPRQIKTDVRRLLAALYKRAGLPPQMEVGAADASAAETRIHAFEKRNCKA